MKELKDYQPLYLGCEVIGYYQAKDVDTGKEVIVELKKRLVRVDEDGTAWLTGNIRIKEFKLVLRPLSDMAYDEINEMDATMALQNASPVHHISVKVWTANTFKLALSKHFDLFGLIDAGLAIDKTKLPTPNTP